MTPRTATALAFSLFACFVASIAFAEVPSGAPSCIRLADDRAALQTPVLTYTHPARVTMTLIGTVHVASPEYYKSIAQMLPGFDSVLIEGVRRSRAASNVVSHDYAGDIGLVMQTRTLDLTGVHTVSADLTEAAFDRVRNAATPTAAAPTTCHELANGLLQLGTDPQTLALTEQAYAIADRNEAAVTVLRQRMARGDASIAMLYGVAHLPDLHARLLKLGFTLQSTQWQNAFDVDANQATGEPTVEPTVARGSVAAAR